MYSYPGHGLDTSACSSSVKVLAVFYARQDKPITQDMFQEKAGEGMCERMEIFFLRPGLAV